MNNRAPERASSTTPSLLLRVRDSLAAGNPEEARCLLASRKSTDPALLNARGVCLLRLGRAREAIELYRPIVYHGQTLVLDSSQPPAFATNLATALILDGNVRGALILLQELRRDEDRVVQELRADVERWRAALGRWDRLLFSMYGTVRHPVALTSPPGTLWVPEPSEPQQPQRPHRPHRAA